MPKMSMTMTQGDIVQWNAAPGDEVTAGDAICEVMTDKVDMDVESPVSGTLLRIDVEEGTVDVGTPIAWISSDQPDPMAGLFDDDQPPAQASEQAGGAEGTPSAPYAPSPAVEAQTPQAAPEGAQPQPEGAQPQPEGAHRRPEGAQRQPEGAQPQQPASAAPDAGPVPAVPKARALATEHGIELSSVQGTGPGGRVLVEDVENALSARQAPQPGTTPAPTPTPPTPPTPPPAPATSWQPAPRAVPAPPSPLTPPQRLRAGSARSRSVRASVAKAMTASAAVPQFTVWRDLELEAVDAARAGISWTTLLLRGYAMALREVPALMGRWDGEEPQPVHDLGIGLAVDTPDGLLLPVFAEPDRVPLEQLDADVRATSAAAKGGKVDAAHLLPAVATLSNLGGLGVDRFQALVTPPQASIIAAGAVSRRPVAVPGGLGLGLRVTVGLSVDHRVADGADGARLLEALSQAFTQPLRLLGPSGAR
ncbi:MAG TPA: dihydrolipoamide acetyltransferase family protein [Actinomycetales bacterium]|nr:dihydrolipoamide acetyltransferase family protein [Actinomycetales bacterium]